MENMFRYLKANEIDCRVSQINEKGLALLLYKDARVDMDILDETVGAKNWQRKHTRDNANCIIEIWDEDKKEWISKEDTGTESFTEKEKGLASDSFKRAGFNWGIGRELYTAPFIYIPVIDEKNETNFVLHICKISQALYLLVFLCLKVFFLLLSLPLTNFHCFLYIL